jgi:hypothetical protein
VLRLADHIAMSQEVMMGHVSLVGQEDRSPPRMHAAGTSRINKKPEDDWTLTHLLQEQR